MLAPWPWAAICPPMRRHRWHARWRVTTGLRVEPIEKNNLRIVPDTFGSELLRDKGKVIGDLDTRCTGDVGDGEKSWDFHPAYSAVRGIPLPGAAISELGYKIDVPYRRAFKDPGPASTFGTAERFPWPTISSTWLRRI